MVDPTVGLGKVTAIMKECRDTWFFPRLSGGEEQGLNDAGVETFKNQSSLGRETIQNVQDARSRAAIEAGHPALVEFELLQMPSNQMPGHDLLAQIFKACRENVMAQFYPKDHKANGLDFLDRGIALLEGDVIPVLRIRDRNTTGLLGTGSDGDKSSPWWRLIRGQGWASAEGVGGGTYGIGQRAPFAFSSLRTVLYSTRLEDGDEAFVAKSILCSFRHPVDGYLTQSKGWYCRLSGGVDDGDGPTWDGIRDPDSIPGYFRRDNTGTDLYVTGYKDSSNWKRELRRSVLRNFFASIHAGSLQVHVKDGDETEKLDARTVVKTAKTEAGL